MDQHEIEVKKTARYYTHGELSSNTKHVWFVCHGYQQLAKYFIKNFTSLDETHFIVAPEGFHRFYLNGYSGRVGASWMTSEDRLNDIKDYVNFLDQLHNEITKDLNHKVIINVLGFSQGGATVSRWACQGKTKIDNLILWAAVFPPDLDFEADKDVLNKLNFHIIIGDNDEFIDETTINNNLDILNQNEIVHHFNLFKGDHKIYPEVLKELVNKL